MNGINSTVTLIESKRHELSLSSFHLLAAESVGVRKKWGSFSRQTKENIYLYFQYMRGLVEVHSYSNYYDYDYWKKWFQSFVREFDEANPYYDGNFEKVVLQNKALMEDLRQ